MRAGTSLAGPNEKWLSCDSHFLYRVVPRRGLGHTGATPAGQAGPAFLVLARCAQAHRLLGQKKNGCLATAIFYIGWCPGEDSNLHTLRHMDLNHARLPIPPPGHKVYANALPITVAYCAYNFKRRKV